MAIGTKSWLDAQDDAQDSIIKDMDNLRRFAMTPSDHEAIDTVIDQAKEIRARIAARRMRSAMFKG